MIKKTTILCMLPYSTLCPLPSNACSRWHRTSYALSGLAVQRGAT